jgi:hypothetical protein
MEDMINPLWGDTPEWESRDDHIDRIVTDDLVDVSCTHLIYLTLRREFSTQYLNFSAIHLDDDEFGIR